MEKHGTECLAKVRETKAPPLRCVSDETGNLTWQPERVEDVVRNKWLPQVFQFYKDKPNLKWEGFYNRYQVYLQEGSQAFPGIIIMEQYLYNKLQSMSDQKKGGLDGVQVKERKRVPIWIWTMAARIFNRMATADEQGIAWPE